MKIIAPFALTAAASALALAFVIPNIVEPLAAMLGILAIFSFDFGRPARPIRVLAPRPPVAERHRLAA